MSVDLGSKATSDSKVHGFSNVPCWCSLPLHVCDYVLCVCTRACTHLVVASKVEGRNNIEVNHSDYSDDWYVFNQGLKGRQKACLRILSLFPLIITELFQQCKNTQTNSKRKHYPAPQMVLGHWDEHSVRLFVEMCP